MNVYDVNARALILCQLKLTIILCLQTNKNKALLNSLKVKRSKILTDVLSTQIKTARTERQIHSHIQLPKRVCVARGI